MSDSLCNDATFFQVNNAEQYTSNRLRNRKINKMVPKIQDDILHDTKVVIDKKVENTPSNSNEIENGHLDLAEGHRKIRKLYGSASNIADDDNPSEEQLKRPHCKQKDYSEDVEINTTEQHSPEDPLLPSGLSDVACEEGFVLINGTIKSDIQIESSFVVGLQVFFPFLVAGIGTVTAGLLLDVVQVT